MAGGLAIVMSGGGAKGAFQVGVLDELARRGITFDTFAGVSTGAIQALGGAQGDLPGLLAAWTGLRGNRDVFTKKPLGVAGALFGADSLYDPAPIRARIKAFANDAKLRATGKKLRLGVVSLTSGLFRSIDETTPGIHNWVYASSAQPPYFPPLTTRAVDGREEQWVDGGVRDVTPLGAALDTRPRAVLVVMTQPLVAATQPPKKYDDLVEIGLRSVSLLQAEVMANDTAHADQINALLGARVETARRLRATSLDAATQARILAPFETLLTQYRFAPIRILAPPVVYSDTLEFVPAKIAAAIAGGREAVVADWAALQGFLA